MKKFLAKLLVILIILQIISPIGIIGQVFAVSNSWDFTTATDYTVSDTDKINLYNGQAKLKSSLSQFGRLNDGPVLLGQATQIEISGNYAYITAYGSNAIEIIDISDSSNPTHVANITVNNTNELNGAYGLKIKGDYLYVASYIDDAIEIINISDPYTPTHVTSVVNDASTRLNGPRGLDILGDYLYVASYSDNALQIIDISDPTNPIPKGLLKDDVKLKNVIGIKISGNYAYINSNSKDRLEVVDITDPDNPVFFGELLDNTGDSRLNGAWGIDIKGTNAYISSYVDDTFEIVDISDPSAPVHLSYVRNTYDGTKLNGPEYVKIDGNYAYITSYLDDSIQIIDISDPSNPIVKGYLQDITRLDGASGIFILGDIAYITSSDGGSFQIVDISNKDAPSFLGELKGGPVKLGGPTNIITEGDYAYISSSLSHSVEIVNIADKTNPIHNSVISATNTVKLKGVFDLQKVGNYLYTANDSDDSMSIIDISDPNNPFQAGLVIRDTSPTTIKLNGARGIYVDGNYVYVASYTDDAMQIIDVTDPINPIVKGYVQDSTRLDGVVDVVVKGNYAYVSSYRKDRIQVVDISDKDNPVLVNELLDSSEVELNGSNGLEIVGNYLYVSAIVDDGIQIYDISDGANPTAVSNITNSAPIKLNGSRNGIIDEGYIYIGATNDDAVQILDTSDVNIFSPINYYQDTLNLNGINGITKQGNYIFTANNLQNSLEILKENYFADSPFVTPNNAFDYSGDITSLNHTLGTYNAGNVTYQISKDDGTIWYYYDGASWISTTGGTSNSNNLTDINNNIAGFNALAGGTDKFKFKAFLNSNGEQKVELSEFSFNSGDDEIAPVISGTNFSSGALIPGANHNLEFDYSDEDGGSGINTASGNIILEKWDSGASSWGDVSSNIGTGTLTETGAIYPISSLDYGKYKVSFDISDNSGNKSEIFENTFYIDKPELIISTGSINIGTLNDSTNTFGDTLTVIVKTIGAGFEVKLKKNNFLTQVNSGDIIPYYDGTLGMGYDKNSDGNLSDYNDDIIMQEVENINTNGDLNIYTYTLKMGAIIEKLQSSGNYSGKIDFGIELDY